MVELFEALRDFLETGGWVLSAIAWLIFFMWLLILERVFYFFTGHKAMVKSLLQAWDALEDKASWNAEQIRQAMVSRLSLQLKFSIPIIQAMVALCPLLGLLGTVTGMISVFDVMAISGGGNARSMAAGVSQATIPTMAGMVGALSGVFASTWLTRKTKTERMHIEDMLEMQRPV